jgi:D-lactate dehydrogenase
MFSTKGYERPWFDRAAEGTGVELQYLEPGLQARTASLAEGCGGVCAFVNDRLDAACLERLAGVGVGLVALRSAGFNHVDLAAAERLGLTVARVPAYSPHAVAEHAVALLLTLNRRIHRAYNRVREHNFELDGLMGFDLAGKTVGCIGTGRIGTVFCRIMLGFGCAVIASDPVQNPACAAMGVRYTALDRLLAESDVVALHCPLNPATHHLIDARALALMRPGALLINTSRGGVVDTPALIAALKRDRLGGVALDVYEEEADLFFRDLSERPIQDDVFARLLTFPNVVLTAHQGFFTREAMQAIAQTTLANAAGYARAGPPGVPTANLVTSERIAPTPPAGSPPRPGSG